ncbi:rhomboid family intramembrane serine protease [Gynuella sp.]|uniref:rhomboid family intramembrane serine protease n=1 Tax=Gynuella sp. TaxID=2969146 RepID=UPI003D0A899C
MLILPMERTFDITRPPLVTWLLILFNCVIFIWTSIGDSRRLDQIAEAYSRLDILPQELPVYQSYLQQSGRFNSPLLTIEHPEQLSIADQHQIAVAMLVDADYQPYASQHLPEFVDYDKPILASRGRILSGQVSELSWNRYGFIPAQISVLTVFSHQFLHGGLEHLLGNMIILLLVGMTVEQLLGSMNYLIFYLFSGAVGALFFGLLNWGSPSALVGASGAISGVMGMYVAAYGHRKIRFFYFIGVAFNYFRATALLILPVWIAKELFDLVFSDAPVAYAAHAGGMACGALLVWSGRNSWARVNQEIIENRDDDADYREQLQQALQAVNQADFVRAKKILWRLAKQHPLSHRVFFQLYHLEKVHPDNKTFHLAASGLLRASLADGQFEVSEQAMLKEYWSLAQPHPQIPAMLLSKILVKLLTSGQPALAEKMFAEAVSMKVLSDVESNELRRDFARFFAHNNPETAKKYSNS